MTLSGQCNKEDTGLQLAAHEIYLGPDGQVSESVPRHHQTAVTDARNMYQTLKNGLQAHLGIPLFQQAQQAPLASTAPMQKLGY